MQIQIVVLLLIMIVIIYSILLFINRVLKPKDRNCKEHPRHKIMLAMAAVPIAMLVLMVIGMLDSQPGFNLFAMFCWVVTILLAYYAWRSRSRLAQWLVSGAVLISAISLGHIFGRNYFYAHDPAASIAGAVSFTITAIPEFIFGCLAGRKQWKPSWIFLIACLSSPLVLLGGGIVMLFIAIVNGWV